MDCKTNIYIYIYIFKYSYQTGPLKYVLKISKIGLKLFQIQGFRGFKSLVNLLRIFIFIFKTI